MSDITQFTVDFFKVLSDQTRLQILELLKDNEITQKEIEEKLASPQYNNKITQSTISQQLKTLVNSNLIAFDKKDNKNFYRIKHKEFFKLFNDIKDFIKVKDLDVLNTLF